MTYVFPFKIIGLAVVFVDTVPGYCFKTVLWLYVGNGELPIREGVTIARRNRCQVCQVIRCAR